MRTFHCLALNSTRNDLMSIVDYNMDDFDLTSFWQGKSVHVAIPPSVKLFCDSVNHELADYVGNPISWPICSQHLTDLISVMAIHDVEFVEAPLFEKSSGNSVRGFHVMNVIQTVPCLDLQESKVSYSPDRSRVTGVFEHVLRTDLIPPDVHIFRPREWMHTIIFSDELAQTFVGKDIKGIAFIRTRSTCCKPN